MSVTLVWERQALETEQVVSSIPGSVGCMTQVHRAYMITRVPSEFSGYIRLDTKIVLKM